MKAFKRGALLWMLAILPACGQQLVEFPQADGTSPDTASADVVIPDVAIPDAAIPDAAIPDAAVSDVAIPDAAVPDVAVLDAAIFEAAITDAGSRDTGDSDVLLGEAGITDSGNRDAVGIDDAEIDAPNSDAPTLDAPSLDAPKIDAEIKEVGSIDGSGPGPGPAIVIGLGLAGPFAIAATAGLTNTITSPITHINGNAVLTPDQTCNAVTVDNAGGFGLCAGMPPTITGTVITNVYPDTTTAAAIKADLNAAFLSITPLAGPPAVGSLAGGTAIAAPTTLGNTAGSPLVLGDNWFTPGVYTSITSILITGDMTLDGQGDPNAIFVFQPGGPCPHPADQWNQGFERLVAGRQLGDDRLVLRGPGQHPGRLRHHHEDRRHGVWPIDGGGMGRWFRGVHFRLERSFRAGQWVPALVEMGRSP
jgi:hypothetical protein